MESIIEPEEWMTKARQLHQNFQPGDYGDLVALLTFLVQPVYFLEAQTSIATDPELSSEEISSNREVLLGLANRILEDHLPGQRHLWCLIALTYLAQEDRENMSIALGVARSLEDEPIGVEAMIYAFAISLGKGMDTWRELTDRYLSSNVKKENQDYED